MSIATEHSLQVKRTFNASRERVFAAWTEPAHIKQWFGPQGCSVSGIEVDFRVGGKYRFTAQTEQHGEMTVGGEYREITPPEKLVYTWQWEDDPAYAEQETLVTVEFVDLGGSTEVRVTHENFPTAENVKNHEYGWNGALDKLATYLNS